MSKMEINVSSVGSGPRPRASVEAKREAIEARIEVGRALVATLPTSELRWKQLRWSDYGAAERLKRALSSVMSWFEYNTDWLRKNVGANIAAEYAALGGVTDVSIGSFELTKNAIAKSQAISQQVDQHLRKLSSIAERLSLLVSNDLPAESNGSNTSGAIFVVHGHDMARAQEVARMVERSTDRDAVILREQPNQGRTVLEKFEDYATSAAFAVVILTADDEGRRRGEAVNPSPRGRQNVIFELGFFYGKLGRTKVAVLVDEGVEHPSDVAGLVYTVLDSSGAWKQELARELTAAGITVKIERIP